MRALILLLVAVLPLAAEEGAGRIIAARAFAQADADRDGVLSATETAAFDRVLAMRGMTKPWRERLGIVDTDGDGRITAAECGIAPEVLVAAAPRAKAPAGMRLAADLPYRSVAGVAPHLLSLDVYTPAGVSGAPVLVYVHGGGWAIGDKARIGHKAAWCKRLGAVLVSVNYRLAPAARHPQWNEDVAAAVAWVRDHIATHGGDPQRIALVGHSAGAHLAASVGADPRWLAQQGMKPSDLVGVLLLDGAGYDIPQHMASPLPMLRPIYEQAFTTDRAVWADASPALHVGAQPPPFLIAYASSRGVSSEQSAILVRALRDRGGQAHARGFDGKDHEAMNTDCGKADDPLTVAAEAFLRSVWRRS